MPTRKRAPHGNYKLSPYPKVNERHRKAEWNSRSAGQLRRYRNARAKDFASPRVGLEGESLNPRGKRTTHGLFNAGYVAALMADREAILAEARADTLRARGESIVGPTQVPVSEAHHPDGTFKAEAHVRTLGPAVAHGVIGGIEPTEDGRWRVGDRTFRYKSEAEAALGASTPL